MNNNRSLTKSPSPWQRPEQRAPAAMAEPASTPSAQAPLPQAPTAPPAVDPKTTPRQPPDNMPGAIALLVIAALVVGGYFLIMELSAQSKLQDCLMQGRTNCAPLHLK